jgi:hypothetical protein
VASEEADFIHIKGLSLPGQRSSFPALSGRRLCGQEPGVFLLQSDHYLQGGPVMLLWILLIIIIIVVFGLGFVFKVLFWVALALFILWLVGLIISRLRGR